MIISRGRSFLPLVLALPEALREALPPFVLCFSVSRRIEFNGFDDAFAMAARRSRYSFRLSAVRRTRFSHSASLSRRDG